MIEIVKTINIPFKDNYFKVNVLKSQITGKITYTCFYIQYGREQQKFNHQYSSLLKRFYFFLKKVVLVETPELPVRVPYTSLTELIMNQQHSPNQAYENIVENTQQEIHHEYSLENN